MSKQRRLLVAMSVLTLVVIAMPSRLIKPKSPQDQIMRIDFAASRANGGRSLAAGMNGMVGLWDVENLDQLRAEPICVPDTFVYPTFSSNGNTLVSLSGAMWLALDTVRVWDVSLRKPAAEGSNLPFSGKSPPVWLPDLAEAVAGLRPAAEEEETGPAILSELRKEYAGSGSLRHMRLSGIGSWQKRVNDRHDIYLNSLAFLK